MIFGEGIREVAAAYRPYPSSGDKEIDEAVGFLSSLREGPTSLGFLGRQSSSDAVGVAVQLLQEHGRQLTYQQTLKVVETLKTLDERRSVKQRFIVQLLVTIVALAISIAIIFGIIQASDDLKKIGYGLIGTIIGYWLK
jgi:hypothetical protein